MYNEDEPLIGPRVLNPDTTIVVVAGRRLSLRQAERKHLIRVSRTAEGHITGYQVHGSDEPGRPVEQVLWDQSVRRDF